MMSQQEFRFTVTLYDHFVFDMFDIINYNEFNSIKRKRTE